jgi:GT2 family glycosyltransferase
LVLSIDDDTIVTSEAIHALVSALKARPEAGIVSPRILHADTLAAQFDFGHRAYEPANFHGACHLVRGALFDRVGFNDEVCSFGGEELDYSIRARAAGYRVLYAPDATVFHNSKPRLGSEDRDRRVRWLHSFVRVHHKHFPLNLARRLTLRYSLGHLLSGIRTHGPGITLSLLGATARGIRDGRREHSPAPDEVIAFYANPEVRPDFGNVPLSRKLSQRLGFAQGQRAA